MKLANQSNNSKFYHSKQIQSNLWLRNINHLCLKKNIYQNSLRQNKVCELINSVRLIECFDTMTNTSVATCQRQSHSISTQYRRRHITATKQLIPSSATPLIPLLYHRQAVRHVTMIKLKILNCSTPIGKRFWYLVCLISKYSTMYLLFIILYKCTRLRRWSHWLVTSLQYGF